MIIRRIEVCVYQMGCDNFASYKHRKAAAEGESCV